MREMIAAEADHVYLDGRELGAQTWQHRFPTILASCLEHGIDPVTELIPVVPAAHYASGGVRTDASMAGPTCRACTRAARWPALACTGLTAWPPTHCWRAWSSPSASPRILAARPAAEPLQPGDR